MEVILLERMRHLGILGQVVKVKPGFARNYLIPKGKAVYANAENKAKVEEQRAVLEKQAAEKHQIALAKQESIQKIAMVKINAKAGEEGKLFGSIGLRDISEALEKAGIEIEKRYIKLPEGSLRMLGEYDIAIELESDVTAMIKVNIVSEG